MRTSSFSFYPISNHPLTGYIGGPILSRFIEREDPNLSLTALVRSPEKVEKLRKLNVRGLNLVIGSHNDVPLVERLVSEADVVFSMVSLHG